MFVFFKTITASYDVFITKCNDRSLSVLKTSKLSNKITLIIKLIWFMIQELMLKMPRLARWRMVVFWSSVTSYPIEGKF